MAFDRFYIGYINNDTGLQTNVKPFAIPDEAFQVLQNAYVFRGRVRKRFGSDYMGTSQLTSRFRVNIGTTDGAGNFAGNTPNIAGVPIVTPAIGQLFSIGTQVFTVVALGNPAVMLISGAATLATFDTTTGAVTINGADINTIVYYYPALPVMGLRTFEDNDVNNEPVIGFDTRFAYEYNNGWERLNGEVTANAARWTGSNSEFFWSATWTGTNAFEKVFFVTNFNENEPNFMRFFFNNQWDNFRPQIDATPNFLNSARLIVPFKNRLLFFNTWEGPAAPLPGDNYPNRVRYSQVGSPLDVNAFRQDLPGRGNAVDAPTTEAIVTIEFVKDRLIVFFEDSTWELVYTGNQVYPFVWQQINTELGAESTFSIVPFDKVALGVGNVGIHACNGVNVERIDDKIPDTVFDIHNVDEGPFRVYGIRDYYVEMVYWTFPDTATNTDFPFPNRVLVFNYKTGTWAFNNDSITAFGYFQPQTGVTWDSTIVTWDDDVSWNSGALSARFRQVIAGNQEGYTFVCDADAPTNASVIQITQIALAVIGIGTQVTITAINHNFRDGEYIYLEGITGTGNITVLNDTIQKVVNPIGINTFTFNVDTVIIAGTYSGAGVIARVSNIVIQTKEYNFYAQKGRNAYIQKVDFMVDATPAGQTQVEFFSSTAITPLLQDASGTGTLLGTGTLETFPFPSVPFEATASRVWHPVYFQAEGEVVQFKLIMNDAQMKSTAVRSSPFQLNAIIIHAMPTTDRLQ